MDYVPQEKYVYDTRYDELEELDCRACHGDSLADRHHHTDVVLRDRLCTPCHDVCTTGEPGCTKGVIVKRDCTTSGCHDWNYPGDLEGNGWHHFTDFAASENCIACHPEAVAEIGPLQLPLEQYPPTVVTPTPYSCSNCHWSQKVHDQDGAFDSSTPYDLSWANTSLAGHPSTFEHENQWGNFIGYYEYEKEIMGNEINHHMGGRGYVVGHC
jgi:hypothetical protein